MMHFINSIGVQILLTIYILVARCDNELFKINKLNLVWSKAQHSLGETKLKDLKGDLSKHEFDELTLKKMKAHNQDKDGLFESTVRKKLHLIMTKYSIERYYDDIHPPTENQPESKRINLSKPDHKESDLKSTFRDKKLDKLWRKAEQSGFTQEQLMILHEEFQDQQDKLDEHYDTMNFVDDRAKTRAQEEENLRNSIESNVLDESDRVQESEKTKETSSEKKAQLEENVHQILRENYKGIKRDIDLLQKKVISGKIDEKQGPFEEAPVNNLWIAAIQANFTADELQSLKEELEHYQVRIKKLKHFEVQLERNTIESKDSTSFSEIEDETKHIRRRVKELTNKVHKLHKSLETKIINRRDEL